MIADQILDFFGVKHLYQQLKGYLASDTSLVHSSGDETLAGTKTFSSTIVGSVSGTASGLSSNSGVTAGSYGPEEDVSPSSGGTITVPQVTVDAQGLVTGAADRTVTLPSGGGGGTKIYIGTCNTDASTSQKIVSIDDETFTLERGTVLICNFNKGNTADTMTVNVNNTGAITVVLPCGNDTGKPYIPVGATIVLIYGMISRNMFYGVCSPVTTQVYCSGQGGSRSKLAVCSGYTLRTGNCFMITFTEQNTATQSLSLKIGNTTAKPLYINGTASGSSNRTLLAGTYLAYYDGEHYQIRNDGKLPIDIAGTAAGLSTDSGVTAGSYGPSADASPEAGGTIVVPQITVDAKGLITGADNKTITFPAGGGGGSIDVGLGLIKENGVIRLALRKQTSYGDGQILLNIAEQYNTPYSYDDDEDTYEDNPSPYIIELSNVSTKFSTLGISVGSFQKTQEQVDALKLQMKSVLTITHWDSGKTTRDITEIPSSAWVSNGVLFDIHLAISSQPLDYPDVLLFDTINRVECIMLNTTNAYGYNIGTFFPAQTTIIVNGSYWG